MSLSAATLSTQLQAISGSNEASTITAWTAMWATYFAGAVAGSGPGVPFTTNPTRIANAKADMAAAMVGMCTSGAAAAKIQAGIIAWWGRLSSLPSQYFSTATSVTAPGGLTSIAAAFPAIFTLNQLEVTKAPACDRIANMLHANNAGGNSNLGTIT